MILDSGLSILSDLAMQHNRFGDFNLSRFSSAHMTRPPETQVGEHIGANPQKLTGCMDL